MAKKINPETEALETETPETETLEAETLEAATLNISALIGTVNQPGNDGTITGELSEIEQAFNDFTAGKLPKILPYFAQTFTLKKLNGKIGYYADDDEVAYEANSKEELLTKISSFRPVL